MTDQERRILDKLRWDPVSLVSVHAKFKPSVSSRTQHLSQHVSVNNLTPKGLTIMRNKYTVLAGLTVQSGDLVQVRYVELLGAVRTLLGTSVIKHHTPGEGAHNICLGASRAG